jgi:hypothetical protein
LGKYLPNLKIGSYDNSHAPEPVRAFLGKVVDVVGTLDECRFTFTYEGLHVSKEIARIYYRRTEWAKEVEEAKKKAKEQGIEDWKRLVKTEPPKLRPKAKNNNKPNVYGSCKQTHKKNNVRHPKTRRYNQECEKYWFVTSHALASLNRLR